MKTEAEVRRAFELAKQQRDSLPKNTRGRGELNVMARHLAWVLDRPDAPTINWTDEQVELAACLD